MPIRATAPLPSLPGPTTSTNSSPVIPSGSEGSGGRAARSRLSPALPASTTSRAPSTATWRRATSASTCASTRRPAFRRSATNDLIGNFKKPPRTWGTSQWYYKERAIDRLAAELAAALEPEWLRIATLVPIPPSKARTDPQHDDRMLRLLHCLDVHLAARDLGSGADAGRRAPSDLAAAALASRLHPGGLDIRELILQRESTTAAHAAPGRFPPSHLATLYTLDESLAFPAPHALALFDDVLTTGAHFKAAQHLLRHRFPGTPIAGIFLARTPHTLPRTGGTECRTLSSWVKR